MKKYSIEINVSIKERCESYMTPEKPVRFTVDENVPEGVNPVPYLAARLSEEIKRHSSTAKIDWREEDEELTSEDVVL